MANWSIGMMQKQGGEKTAEWMFLEANASARQKALEQEFETGFASGVGSFGSATLPATPPMAEHIYTEPPRGHSPIEDAALVPYDSHPLFGGFDYGQDSTSFSLPYDPEELDRELINECLIEIDNFDSAVQDEMMGDFMAHFANQTEVNDLSVDDMLNLYQIQSYAVEHDYQEWVNATESILDMIFEEVEFDPEISARTAGSESITFEEARSQLIERKELIREATENNFQSIPDERKEEAISQTELQYLCILLGSIEGISLNGN